MKISRVIGIAAGIVLLGAGFVVLSDGYLRGVEICTVCGEQSDVTWMFGKELSRGIRATRLSTMLAAHGIPGPHDHHWSFAQGSGIPPLGPSCAIGRGRYLFWSIESSECVTFLDDMIRFDSVPAAEPYIREALDSALARPLQTALRSEEFPENGFGDGDAFRRWWGAHRTPLDAAVVAR